MFRLPAFARGLKDGRRENEKPERETTAAGGWQAAQT
jgi:hypothetical protein